MRISLDTCYLWGLKENCLNELQKRGFVISTSFLSLHEMWARSFRENNKNLLCNRMKILLKYLDHEIPVIPYGIELRKEIVNKFTKSKDFKLKKENKSSFYEKYNYQFLVKIVTMTDSEWKENGQLLNTEIDNSAIQYLNIFKHNEFFEKNRLNIIEKLKSTIKSNESVEEVFFHKLKPFMKDNSISQKIWQKCDAWLTYWTLNAIKSNDQYAPCSNDDYDSQLLMQIAFPALFLTNDRRLMNVIHSDDSKKSWTKTYQSPWIKTFGELITDPLPTGVPWGKSAKKQALRFLRRRRSEIYLLEESVIKSINSK